MAQCPTPPPTHLTCPPHPTHPAHPPATQDDGNQAPLRGFLPGTPAQDLRDFQASFGERMHTPQALAALPCDAFRAAFLGDERAFRWAAQYSSQGMGGTAWRLWDQLRVSQTCLLACLLACVSALARSPRAHPPAPPPAPRPAAGCRETFRPEEHISLRAWELRTPLTSVIVSGRQGSAAWLAAALNSAHPHPT